MKMSRRMIQLTVCLLTLFITPICGTPTPHISTPNGPLFGQIIVTNKSHSIDAFLGVPFGEKTVRFKKSVMKKSWTTPLDVSNFGHSCMNGRNDSDDCLFLKILRPTGTTNTSMLPVIFWPPGGGFYFAEADFYDYFVQSDNFVSKRVIFKGIQTQSLLNPILRSPNICRPMGL